MLRYRCSCQSSLQKLDRKGKKVIYLSLGLIFCLGTVLYLAQGLSTKYWLLDQLHRLLERHPTWAIGIFVGVGALSIGIGVPRASLALIAGVTFGFWLGIVLAEVASLIGAFSTFIVIKWCRKTFQPPQKITELLPPINRHIRCHGFSTVLILRQVPLPGWVINAVLGLSAISIADFVAGSCLGFLPQNLIFVLYGSGLRRDFWTYIGLASSLFIVCSVILYFLYRHSQFIRAVKNSGVSA